MKKVLFILSLILWLNLSLSSGLTQEQIFENELAISDQEFVPGEVVVKFKKGILKEIITNLISNFGTSILYESPLAGFLRLKIPVNKNVYEMVEKFRKNPFVEYAEPNYIARITMTPNDPYYRFQWHLDNPAYGGINMEEAWEITKGNPSVIVAVLDTGVAYEDYTQTVFGRTRRYYRAPDLANTKFVAGYDFINNDNHPNDDNGHGTHVTGTIAQSTNNGIGVAGIAPNCSIMPIKVLSSSGSGPYSAISDGIRWAADNGAKVINLSLGGSQPSITLENALSYAYGKGVTIVCAAGNEGQPTLLYPAAYDAYCIAVGAIRYDEIRAYYSNYSNSLDLVAPGGDLNVDQNGDGYGDGVLQQTFSGSYNNWGYWFYQGTSMATPHVSGVAALLISAGVATTPDLIRHVLQSTAKDLGPPGFDPEYGWGRVDALAALRYSSVPPEDITPPSPNPMTWATEPYATGSTSIAMAATQATDTGSPSSPPVAYYFAFVDSPTGGTGGVDSGWQGSTSYTNTGLQANHRYGYRVKARDSAPALNETDYSAVIYKYTLANVPGTPAFSNVTSTCIQANWTANGNSSGTQYFCENTTAGTNSGWTTSASWNSCNLNCGTSYSFRVKARNGDGTETVWTNLSSTTTAACETDPPVPNPMTWATPPYAAGTTSIAMTATTATDASPPVQYYFDFIDSPTGGLGGADSGWQTATSYTNSGLGINHRYGYQVKARDGLGAVNTPSSTFYAYTAIETPSGITFGTITTNSIQAQSTNTPSGLTRGSSGLLIENVTKGVNSGWKQDNNFWTNDSLLPNTKYGYRAQARNGDGVTTSTSSTVSRFTLANMPGASTFSNVTSTCIQANWTTNGNPDGTQYFCENRTAGTNSGWTTTPSWNNCGLSGSTSYSYRVKARNGDGVETDWTSLGSQVTEPTSPPQNETFNFSGTIGASQENRHQISVKSGAKSLYARLTWTSGWVDLRLRIYNPSGTRVAEVDNSTTGNRTEETTIINPSQGNWQVGGFSESRFFSTPYTLYVEVSY